MKNFSWAYRSPWNWFQKSITNILLPTGFPTSVKREYLPYQLWLSLQSTVGSASYVLSMHALLAAVGVGAETSLPIAAATAWILKDGIGNIGVILFAGKMGRRVDVHPKKSKFGADVLHCIGVGMEILTPLVPTHFIFLASLANLTKGVAGVLGGAAKATFNKHFCEGENMGDVTAKGQAQGTSAYLVGLGLGLSTSAIATTLPLTIGAYAIFTTVYLTASVKAIRTLALRTLNLERLNLLLSSWFRKQPLPPPHILKSQERLFWTSRSTKIVFGASLAQAFETGAELEQALIQGKDKEFLIGERNDYVHVVLHDRATPYGMFEGYFVAQARLQRIQLERDSFAQFQRELANQGWGEVLLDAPATPRGLW